MLGVGRSQSSLSGSYIVVMSLEPCLIETYLDKGGRVGEGLHLEVLESNTDGCVQVETRQRTK